MEQCVEYAKQTLPQAQLYGGAHGMGSEDFGSISQACTANYVMIGAAAGPLNECYGPAQPPCSIRRKRTSHVVRALRKRRDELALRQREVG